MVYIHNSISVSIQPEGGDYSTQEFPAEVQHPVYKELIKPGLLRRMKPGVRMGVYSALKCLGERQVDSIIVATGLGCLKDTELFLRSFSEHKDSFLSPTSFIQSTHNTVAGQIALLIGNHGYNMTYSQDGTSFETSLLDAILCVEEGMGDSLLGGLDEKIDLLSEMGEALSVPKKAIDMFSEGAAFFLLSDKEQGAVAKITLADVLPHQEDQELPKADLILYGHSGPMPILDLGLGNDTININSLCGSFMTNPAFALDMAVRILNGEEGLSNFDIGNKTPKSILILNDYLGEKLGRVLIEKV